MSAQRNALIMMTQIMKMVLTILLLCILYTTHYCTIVVTTHNKQTVRKYRVFDLNSELFCWLSYSVIVGLN